MIDKRPSLIARCAKWLMSSLPLTLAVYKALPELFLVVATSPGLSLVEDGLVIDLAQMKGIRVDPDARTVRVEPRCRWGDVDHAMQAFGLAKIIGGISNTGVPGLTHGGGNFGIVTSFKLRLHPVNSVIAGPVFWLIENLDVVLRWYRNWLPQALEDIYASAVPPVETFPESIHGRKVCGLMWCCTGTQEQVDKELAEAKEITSPLFEHVGVVPYSALQSPFDDLYPPGPFAMSTGPW